MCRIDKFFDKTALNEASDPTTQFQQALDRYQVDDVFQSLLTKHFSGNWKSFFSDIDSLEDALEHISEFDSIQKKITCLISDKTLEHRLLSCLHDCRSSVSSTSQIPPREIELFEFISDSASSYFPDSAYELWNSALRNSPTLRFHDFVTAFYGENFCFTEAFFTDKSLAALGPRERVDVLWGMFNSMTSVLDDTAPVLTNAYDRQIDNLISFVGDDTQPTAPKEFERGLKFLKAWISNDAIAGRFLTDEINALTVDGYSLQGLEKRLNPAKSYLEIPQEKLEVVNAWLREQDKEIELLQYVRTDLRSRTEEQKGQWAYKFDYYFSRLVNENLRDHIENFRAVEQDCLQELCVQLTSLQIATWIEWSIDMDICALKERAHENLRSTLTNSQKWCASEHYSLWKEKFLARYSLLQSHEKLKLISAVSPFQDDVPLEEGRNWWNQMLLNLVKKNDFPSELIPHWSIAAEYRLEDDEQRMIYLDKGIGVLRRKLSNESTPELTSQLENLTQQLQRLDPAKALRHQLLLLRSIPDLISDESVKRHSSFNEERAGAWYIPLDQFAIELASKRINHERDLTSEESLKSKLKCYEETSLKLAEFCLSRLRLHKGEKAINGKYGTSQITEPSAIWRQGYIKALSELGFDLNGKVHKTLHFTKEADPDESVREIAKEGYRSVRREANKSHSIKELKRGIIAAEWWLLLCQRQALDAPINHKEALRTRRRLLRHPF